MQGRYPVIAFKLLVNFLHFSLKRCDTGFGIVFHAVCQCSHLMYDGREKVGCWHGFVRNVFRQG